MPNKKAPKKGSRIKVEKLQKEKKLSAAEAKKVKGGVALGLVVIGLDKPQR